MTQQPGEPQPGPRPPGAETGWTPPPGAETGWTPPGAETGWTAPGSPAAGSPTPHPLPSATAPGHAVPAGHPAYPPSGRPGWVSSVTAHKPGIIALRPLRLGDILEGSFAAMRRNPRTFFGLSLLTMVAVIVAVGAIAGAGYLVAMQIQGADTLDTFIAVGGISGITGLWLLTVATSVALSGILAYPVGEAVLGRKPSLGETWRRTRRMVPRLVGLSLILLVPVLVVFALIIGGIVWAFAENQAAIGAVGIVLALAAGVAMAWLGVRLALATAALVLEDLGVIASLRRSFRLTGGLFWRTLGILLLANILMSVVQQVLSFAVQVVGMVAGFAAGTMVDPGAAEVVGVIVMVAVVVIGVLLGSVLSQPFLAAVSALLYTDSRIRREGFDLALVRAATGGAGGPAAPAGYSGPAATPSPGMA